MEEDQELDPRRHRDNKGRFLPGNRYGTYRGMEKETLIIRQHSRAELTESVGKLFTMTPKEFLNRNADEISVIDSLLIRAVIGDKEGKPNGHLITYMIDQAIGKAITPVITKQEGKATPKTRILRGDGSIIEYSLGEGKENE